MKAVAVFVLVGLSTLAQVAVSPLFPLHAAVADIGLLGLVLVLLMAGPRSAMVAVPLLGLLLSFATNRSPGLFILAYLPLPPLAYLLGETQLPMMRFVRILTAAVGTGVWARLLFGMVAFLQGADFAPGELIRAIIVPGLVLDALLVTIIYLPCRLAGLTGRSMSLRRTGWVS